MKDDPSKQPLILASGSPYRAELLERLELPFEVRPADIDESPQEDEAADRLAERLALAKASALAVTHPGRLVIGSDQVAVCRGRLLGKPGTRSKAIEQLAWCSGAEVVFHSALALVRDARRVTRNVPTRVQMRSLERERIERYIDRDQPLDCAGAMKSESLGICLARAIESDDPTALIGLPLIALVDLLTEFGIELL
ncbi:septum formation protein Maf [Wenzhouxiangella sp. XN201]|uniref:Maf family nucleotide pyrophosphatase n=1 Tax=Wenzhouxiangella sp. XN201 TaxID=2710755 RepID=UPI0013C87DB4|nr:septum formation protein Maf [Wenzhouxiangella sp. XN201]